MKPYQIKHLKNKIDDIYYQKKKTLEDKMYVEGKYISDEEKVNLIRKGKVKLRVNAEIKKNSHGGLSQYFNFDKYHWNSYYKPEFQGALKKLQNNRDKVLDQIILGGCDKALEILKAWEKSSKVA